MVNPVVKNYFDPITKKFIVGGELEVQAGGKLTVLDGGEVAGITGVTAAATAAAIGGIKAAEKGAGDTVECKIDGTSSKLFVPTYPVLPVAATASTAGLVKAAANQTAIAADAELAALRSAYIDLILKLKASGIMVAD